MTSTIFALCTLTYTSPSLLLSIHLISAHTYLFFLLILILGINEAYQEFLKKESVWKISLSLLIPFALSSTHALTLSNSLQSFDLVFSYLISFRTLLGHLSETMYYMNSFHCFETQLSAKQNFNQVNDFLPNELLECEIWQSVLQMVKRKKFVFGLIWSVVTDFPFLT